ncbi:MAG: hypothetical protein Q7J06_04410 [Bacteroidales bacterium]|nr:hypothetical protein [Bacteroidales bacterium]
MVSLSWEDLGDILYSSCGLACPVWKLRDHDFCGKSGWCGIREEPGKKDRRDRTGDENIRSGQGMEEGRIKKERGGRTLSSPHPCGKNDDNIIVGSATDIKNYLLYYKKGDLLLADKAIIL